MTMRPLCLLFSVGAALLGAVSANPAPNPEPQITGTPAPQQSAAVSSALQDLQVNLGIFQANEVASVTQAIRTADPALQSAIVNALPNVAAQDYSRFQSAVNNIITGSPTGFSALPTDVQEFVKSVASDEASIFNNGGAAPTSSNRAANARTSQRPVALAGLGVAGAVAAAALL